MNVCVDYILLRIMNNPQAEIRFFEQNFFTKYHDSNF